MTGPWWQTCEPGSTIELGFVRIDRVGSTQDWQGLSAEQVIARRAEFYQLTEELAAGFGAMQPVAWEGDGAMVFVGSGPGATDEDPARQAGLLVIELHQRLLMSGFRVRIGVHCGRIGWAEDPGKLASPEIDRAGHLEHDCPDGAVTLSEDVYLSLPPEARQKCAYLGTTRRDRTVAFIYPAAAVSRRDDENFLSSADDPELARHRFLRYVESADIRRLRYVGLRLHRREPPSLDLLDVFTPVDVEAYRRSRLDRNALMLEPAGKKARVGEMPEVPWFQHEVAATPRAFKGVFGMQRHLVVLGAPGAGKSTLVRWLALSAAAGRVVCRQCLGVDERLLPLLVPVGRLSELRESLGRAGTAPSVIDAMAHYFHERSAIEEIHEGSAFLRQRLEAGECLVLLDGLDEVPTGRRHEVARWIESFAAAYRGNRIVVTSRVVGFVGLELPGGLTVTVRPFNDRQVREYVVAWCRAYRAWEANFSGADAVRDRPIADAEGRRLLDVLKRDPRLRSLCGNPFLLSALALVHRAEGQLPAHRVQLYDLFARALCETWDEARRLTMASSPTAARIAYESEAIPVLGRLALWLHEHTAGVAPEAEVKSQIAQALVGEVGAAPDNATRAADEFLQRASRDLQIIAERGAGEYGFLHLTFQEFFAAQSLHAKEQFESAAQAHWTDPRWEEIILLGVGTLSILQKRAAAAGRFIRALLTWKVPGAPWVTDVLKKQVVLAAKCCADAPNLEPSAAASVLDAFVPLLLGTNYLIPERARQALVRMRGSRFASGLVDRLADILRHPWDDGMCERAAAALGVLGDARAVAPLLAALRQRKSDSVRGRAAEALGALADARAVEPLLAALRGEEGDGVRWQAARALSALGDARAVEMPLTALREDKNDETRWRAAVTLGALGDARAVEPLRHALHADRNARVRWRAAEALGKLGDARAVEPLLAALCDDNNDTTVRWSAARALGALSDARAVEPLLVALREAKSDLVRGGAAAALGVLMDTRAVEPLLAGLCEDRKDVVRGNAAGALGMLADARAVEPLLAALRSDEYAWVRGRAAEALGMLGDTRAIEPLVVALRNDENQGVRWDAARALGALGDARAVEPLLAALREDKNDVVRRFAADALWGLSDSLPIDELLAGSDAARVQPATTDRRGINTSRRRKAPSKPSR